MAYLRQVYNRAPSIRILKRLQNSIPEMPRVII
jgi:hypothetical protein